MFIVVHCFRPDSSDFLPLGPCCLLHNPEHGSRAGDGIRNLNQADTYQAVCCCYLVDLPNISPPTQVIGCVITLALYFLAERFCIKWIINL